MKNYQPQGGDSAAEKLSNLHDSIREHQNNQNKTRSITIRTIKIKLQE